MREQQKIAPKNIPIVVKRNGDIHNAFDVSDGTAIELSQHRRMELTGLGVHAVTRGKDGSPGVLICTFNPKVVAPRLPRC